MNSIIENRIQGYISDNSFRDVNLLSFLYSKEIEISNIKYFSVPGKYSKMPFNEAITQKFHDYKLGTLFGPSWTSHWFKITIPALNSVSLFFSWNSGCEGLLFDQEGNIVQGLVDELNEIEIKTEKEKVFYIQVSANGMFGNGANSIWKSYEESIRENKGIQNFGMIDPPNENRFFAVTQCCLRARNNHVWDIKQDLEILLDIYRHSDNSTLKQQALDCANNVINTFDGECEESYTTCLEISTKFLTGNQSYNIHNVIAVGNCHIDSAWLWPYSETRIKTARSWSSQLELMRRYPEYKFVCSQAQQLEWLKDDYPELFQEIKKFVKKGQFIPIGGTWVEMDGNLPSGESFVRQFYYGQKFFKEEFGEISKIFWLPDTFGYSSQLPQIAKLSGLDFFFTQKLSWNNINKFPHTTFKWEGLDGSQLVSHFSPADTYTAEASIADLYRCERNNRSKQIGSSVLVYGKGDGGGGPNEKMLKRLKRMSEIKGIPNLKMDSPISFYENIDIEKLDTWKGELYFELHRGTFTSQARTKKLNRECEFLLQRVEWLCTLAAVKKGSLYPHQEIDRLWKRVLTNQFHDVLPGSCIEKVYQDTDMIYKEVQENCKQLIEHAIEILCDERSEPCLLNELSFDTNMALNGKDIQFQAHESIFMNQTSFSNLCEETILEEGQTLILSNNFARVEFNLEGRLIEFYDKEADRIVTNYNGRSYFLHEDIPLFWDAWDVEIYHLQKKKELKASHYTVHENTINFHYKTSQSCFTETICLNPNSKRLDFTLDVDWHENRKILKVEFDLAIKSDHVSYETQFGFTKRPNHSNTSLDAAKFEVCGHKYADMSETGYGVALLNNCKYGYSARDNILSLSLLRSPKSPDANCDMGQSEIKFALFPHKHSFPLLSVVKEALNFNSVPIEIPSKCDTKLIKMTETSLLLNNIKMAKDGSVVFRFYESLGARGKCLIEIPNAQHVHFCDLLDNRLEKFSGEICFTPFQIVSIIAKF